MHGAALATKNDKNFNSDSIMLHMSWIRNARIFPRIFAFEEYISRIMDGFSMKFSGRGRMVNFWKWKGAVIQLLDTG